MPAQHSRRTSGPLFAIVPLAALLLLFGKSHAGNLYRADDDALLSRGYSQLLQNSSEGASSAAQEFRNAVRRDLASPYRWTDLGAALQAGGNTGQARYCYARALQLGANVAPILLRAANFHLQNGEMRECLASMAKVLQMTAGYDPVIFSYYNRMNLPPEVTLRDGIPQGAGAARAARAYLTSLMSIQPNDPARIQPVWAWAAAQGYIDDSSAAQYVNYLFAQHAWEKGALAWTSHVATRFPDYGTSEFLWNGGFESEPSGAALDWVIQPSKQADAARDPRAAYSGAFSLRIGFHANERAEYASVSQFAVVKPGSYVLRARIRTDKIPSDAGVQLRVFDAESAPRLLVATPAVSGSEPWTAVEAPVLVRAPTRLLTVQILRPAVNDAVHDIAGVAAGTAWIDAVQLQRLEASSDRPTSR